MAGLRLSARSQEVRSWSARRQAALPVFCGELEGECTAQASRSGILLDAISMAREALHGSGSIPGPSGPVLELLDILRALPAFTAEPFGRFDRRRCSEPHSICGKLACIPELSLLGVLRNGTDGAVSPGNYAGCSWSMTLLF
jgi:hypothetical protein